MINQLIALAILPVSLLAQDITGTWQGTVHTTRDFREVIQISKDGNVFKAVLFGIDTQPGLRFNAQPGQSFLARSVTMQGKAIRIEIPGIGGGYQGTLGADGNSIAGSISQDSMTLVLNLVRAAAQTAWEIPNTPLLEKPMAADANPAFEVVSIKPTPPGTQGGGLGPSPGGRFTTHNITVMGLVGTAYGLMRNQIESAPAWLDTDRFDIVAKADMADAPNQAQVMAMLQKLLADRFSLRVHRETKEGTVYLLTVQSSGSKLTPSSGNPNGPPSAAPSGGRDHRHLTAIDMNMEEFTLGLQSNVGRPVIDRTGLSVRFDISLDWAPDQLQSPPPDNSAVFPDIFTALKDQLGLKLESTKGPVEILVIDHIERPSEN